MKQTDTNRSMAVTYETFGRDFLAMVLSVVMVSTVVMPDNEKKRRKKMEKVRFAKNYVMELFSWTSVFFITFKTLVKTVTTTDYIEDMLNSSGETMPH